MRTVATSHLALGQKNLASALTQRVASLSGGLVGLSLGGLGGLSLGRLGGLSLGGLSLGRLGAGVLGCWHIG